MTPLFNSMILTDMAETWAELIVPMAIKGSVLLGLFGILCFLLRRASASARHLLWTLGLTGVLLLPVLSAGLPSWNVLDFSRLAPVTNNVKETIAPAVLTSSPDQTIQLSGPTSSPSESNTLETGASQQKTPGTIAEGGGMSVRSLPVKAWIFLVWQAGALLILGSILTAAVRLWRIKRNARNLSEDGWSEHLGSLCLQLGIPRLPRLKRTPGDITPMTCGLRRTTILLPGECNHWTNEQRNQVLLHELAHIKRRDCSTQIAAQLACLIYWFNPLVWLAVRQMRIERERACDDQVLITGVKASSYAKNLLDLTCSLGSKNRTLAFGVGMARRSQISGRLLAVLDPKRRRLAPARCLTVIAAALTLAIVLPLAVLSPTVQAKESRLNKSTISITNDKSTNPYKVKWKGEIELSRDGRDIERMSEGAYLLLEQKFKRTWHKLLIKPDETGKPVYTYKVGRKEKDFDEDAADWLADMLEEIAPDGELVAHELPELPSLPSLPELPSLPSLGSLELRTNDYSTRASWKNKKDGVSMKIEMEGKIEFNENETGIVWMDDDAYFEIEEKKGRHRITLEAAPDDNGRPVYEYKVNRKIKPFDDEAAAWLANVLQDIMMELGFNAEARVRRIHEKDGSKGVLELIGRIDSDYSKSLHYREVLALSALQDDEVKATLEQIARHLDSDYELARIMICYVDTQLGSGGTRDAFLECMSSIDSDYEKARVLKTALDKDDLVYEDAIVVLEAAKDIDSDYEAARVLTSIDPALLSDEAVSRVYFETLEDIDSDYEKAGVLLKLARHARRNEKLRDACLEAADGIDSSYEHNKVRKALR